MSERDMTRVGSEAKPSATAGPQLLNSKSVPALHHIGKSERICYERFHEIASDRQHRKQIKKRSQFNRAEQQRRKHQHSDGPRLLSEHERLPPAESEPAEPR